MYDKPNHSGSPYDIGGIGRNQPAVAHKPDAENFHALLSEEVARTEVLVATLASRLSPYAAAEDKIGTDALSLYFSTAYFRSAGSYVESLARHNAVLSDLINRLSI